MAYVIMGFGNKGRTTTRLGWMVDLHRAATFMKRCSSRGSFFSFLFLSFPFVPGGVLTTFFSPLDFNAFLLSRLQYNYKGLGVFVFLFFFLFVYYHPFTPLLFLLNDFF